MTVLKYLVSIIISALVLLQSVSVLNAAPKDELLGVKKEIRAKQQLINKTRKEENTVSVELQEILRSLVRRESELKQLDKELRVVETDLEMTNQEIERTRQETYQKQKHIEHRLKSLYKAGEFGALRMFFSAESFPQMAENMRYMRSVLAQDRLIFAEYDLKLAELRKLKKRFEQEIARKELLKNDITSKKKEIEQDKQKKATYLSKVRQDRKSYEASLKELQANAAKLQSMLNKLEAERRKKATERQIAVNKKIDQHKLPELPAVPDKGFGTQKGRMQIPVQGEIIETFGKHKHPEFNSYTYSKGLVISAPLGSAIRSIYDGTVIFASYFKGYGNMIIIDHGAGYFSLYAYASRLNYKVGADVLRGDVVASVGDVDSSKGPALYFEIRHQGKPVDPAGWVR